MIFTTYIYIYTYCLSIFARFPGKVIYRFFGNPNINVWGIEVQSKSILTILFEITTICLTMFVQPFENKQI